MVKPRVYAINTQMIVDGFSPAETILYCYFWWTTQSMIKKNYSEAIFLPSIATIEKATGLKKRTIIRCTKGLEDAGLIEVDRTECGRKGYNRYRIVDVSEYPCCKNYLFPDF